MVFAQAVLVLALAPFVLGDNSTSSSGALGVEAIEAHFSNAGIVPSLLSSFDPEALLSVSYDGVGAITPGQALTKDQVSPTPSLQVTPANSTVTLNGTFTVVMADAGPVGTDESQGQTRHWLVNGATLTGDSAPFSVSIADGTAITTYAGPAPAQGSGAHRYVILLYTQPSNFSAPSGLDTPNVGVSVFNLGDYVQSSNLGPLVAGTYLTVEEGTASFTPSSTAPVVSSTLPAAQSSGSATSPASSGSVGSSGSSGSGSATSSSPSSSASAGGQQTGDAYTATASVAKTILAAFLGFALF